MEVLFNRFLPVAVATAFAVGMAARGAAQNPGLPASPLAGGMAAATGEAFMDAAGNPIVMPATYGEPMGGHCDPSACGYGDAYADFGGYSMPDQCGPHYFDLSVQTVFLKGEDLFQDVPPLASVGAGALAPKIIDPAQDFDEYEAGWQIAARYDLGPLSVIEATYMGLYDIGFHDQKISSVETVEFGLAPPPGQPFQLSTVFSDYGVGTLIEGLDAGDVYTVDYQSDLQSTELSYRRYWVGYNPRISGTYVAGFRYIRMTEDFTFDSVADDADLDPNEVVEASLLWSTDNDLVGAQLGGDGWIALRQGLRFGGEGKAGIYNNRFKYRHATSIPDPAIDNVDFNTDGNQIAFAGEASVDLVADILPSFSIRGGYRILYLNSLATVGNNIDPGNVTSTALLTQADALYHGFQGGIEYIW